MNRFTVLSNAIYSLTATVMLFLHAESRNNYGGASLNALCLMLCFYLLAYCEHSLRSTNALFFAFSTPLSQRSVPLCDPLTSLVSVKSSCCLISIYTVNSFTFRILLVYTVNNSALLFDNIVLLLFAKI